jgi:hypothetical protein
LASVLLTMLLQTSAAAITARRKNEREAHMSTKRDGESGRVGYLVLYFMGVPIGLLLVLWVLLGNNIFAPG